MGIDPDVQVILDVMQAEIDALKKRPVTEGRHLIKQVATFDNDDVEVWEITP